jgi:hypothetical protein
MAEEIKGLSHFSPEVQKSILESISHSYHPIEIDGEVFMIPEEVNELIDNLLLQIQEVMDMGMRESGKTN